MDIEEELKTKRALIWIIGLIIIILLICGTIIYYSSTFIIRFEMDNNTLEAIKSINWSSINWDKSQQVKSSILNEKAQDFSDGIANRSSVEQTADKK
jgi:flagellar basal body-associated protein FliL